jgi:isocitrate dehydrogenase
MDGLADLQDFADRMERATIELVESGYMTGDLALISTVEDKHVLNLDEFLTKVAEKL